MPSTLAPLKTSPLQSPAKPPPGAGEAQDGRRSTSPSSSSSTATANSFSSSSPDLPPLPAPALPYRVQDLLRTPSPSELGDGGRDYDISRFGSPYPEALRQHTLSSEPSDDSPIHRLELRTRFLRPEPPDGSLHTLPRQPDTRHTPLSAAATVLANRARRPTRGITEDWIRNHTASDSDAERRHWLSDGPGDSESSSLSGSLSGEDAAWLGGSDGNKTPRASRQQDPQPEWTATRRPSLTRRRGHPRKQSSSETLRPPPADELPATSSASTMASDLEEWPAVNGEHEPRGGAHSVTPTSAGTLHTASPDIEQPETLSTAWHAMSGDGQKLPITPPRPASKSVAFAEQIPPPNPRRRVPWRGKSVLVLLPQDDERGQPDRPSKPLDATTVAGMLRSWRELGYSVDGFDLSTTEPSVVEPSVPCQTKGPWPDFEDMAREHAERRFRVVLPDLEVWKRYVQELQEAKLRALGVSFDDGPPLPSISPAGSAPISRQASVTYYPTPFSPTAPNGSAASTPGAQAFPPFGQFAASRTQSPNGVPAVASPVPFFGGKYNPRASISVPSPRQWLQQQGHAGHRMGSPSLANFNSIISPTSPFSPDGFAGPGPMGAHQRHQSLQYPMLQHQFQQPARASPRLQELREVEEEPEQEPVPKVPEPVHMPQHKAAGSLQNEIQEAEYHLEAQMRSQLDNDQDYSPHRETGRLEESILPTNNGLHAREPSVQFVPQPPRFGGDADELVLHHPRPHSRGHSLSQRYFNEDDAHAHNTFLPHLQSLNTQAGEETELETNPSNMGTPLDPSADLGKLLHQRGFSTASNPWTDNESNKSFRPSHASKPSLSKLNVEAPEFKFNPSTSNTFKPGHFVFGSNTFQPVVPAFNAGIQSNTSTPFSNQSKTNAGASVFSPSKGDFNFSMAGPKFRPDAPSFTPMHSLSNSVTSPPMSGGEGGSKGGSSIFGNIDLGGSEMALNARRSKAIPIVRPASRHSSRHASPAAEMKEDEEGRPTVDDSRVKRARGRVEHDDDDVPLFAEPSQEATPIPEPKPTEQPSASSTDGEHSMPAEEKSFDESNLGQTDMTVSTVQSEVTDTKAIASPIEGAPLNEAVIPWAPFELNNTDDIVKFDMARPFGEDNFKLGHKKSLSATAKAFVPGSSLWTASDDESAQERPNKTRLVDRSTEDTRMEDTTISSIEVDKPALGAPLVAAEPPCSHEPSSQVQVGSSPPPVAPGKGRTSSRFAKSPSPVKAPSPPPRPKGLAASRFAATPSPPAPALEDEVSESHAAAPPVEPPQSHTSLPVPGEDFTVSGDEKIAEPVELRQESEEPRDDSMPDLDAVMRHLSENPNLGVNRALESPSRWQPSPTRHISVADVAEASPHHSAAVHDQFEAEVSSPSQWQPGDMAPGMPQPILSTEMDDPFLDPPHMRGDAKHVNGNDSLLASDWEDTFTDNEQTKLESRANFFDGRVSELFGSLLDARLRPFEAALDNITHAVAVSRNSPSGRRDRRSMSAEIWDSDADDEDDESLPAPRRSLSPRKDRRMGQIRAAVLEAFAAQERNISQDSSSVIVSAPVVGDTAIVLKALAEMKEHFTQTLHLDFRGEDLRNIVEHAVDSRIPASTAQPAAEQDASRDEKIKDLEQACEAFENTQNELNSQVVALEQQLRAQEVKLETEADARRAAEDRVNDMTHEIESAATKMEIEMVNKSALSQRITDLEDRVRHAEAKAESEINGRRTAEDRLSEVQRLLRIASEEENRLREVVEERDQKIEAVEAAGAKSSTRLAFLEAEHSNGQQSLSDSQNRINNLEADLRSARQEARHWRSEADRLVDGSHRLESDLVQTQDENKALHRLIDTLGTQLQEQERMRDNWRTRFIALQEDMAQAARQITEENARRAKKEQALLARQEVLDAKLQAEARTRERIEAELERLESCERQGIRAVAESKRLEVLLGDMRTENHKLQQNVLRCQAESQEARESAAREVQRTQDLLQAEVEKANNQANIVREELEGQVFSLRAQLDQVKLDADTTRAQHEMLLGEAQHSKAAAGLQEATRRHQNDMEDMQARYERQLANATEDGQRAERNLLERLSISASKSEYLQDKVAHLEEKLEIAKAAAKAAAQAAKSSVSVASPVMAQGPLLPLAAAPATATQPRSATSARQLGLPEKISPQALRESIMVLQEQLQGREQRIEELEASLAKTDPEAENKIAKRDDEIVWLRELLAVRHADLQDIIAALDEDDFDRDTVRDAAIRLKANLQMEEQERERAMNGGSAIPHLPSIAATIRGYAAQNTPRGVAQAVGPLAAAWGNWRKARAAGEAAASPVVASPQRSAAAKNKSTPSKNTGPRRGSAASQGGFLGGLLTPPASGLRQSATPKTLPARSQGSQVAQQHTAFSATGRRFTPQDLANRPRAPPGAMPRGHQAGKMSLTIPANAADEMLGEDDEEEEEEEDGESPVVMSGARRASSSGASSSKGPMTPTMMRASAYDMDAQAEDFEVGFFDDE